MCMCTSTAYQYGLLSISQVTSGERYEGVFSSIDNTQLTLRVCKLVRSETGDTVRTAHPVPEKIFSTSEWVRIDATDVRMSAGDVGPLSAADDVGGFGTDAAISRGRGGLEGRELQRWAPDESTKSTFIGLEESARSTRRGWDQFALNEQKFGVRTDYKEELYTTALDPNNSRISIAEAERIAAEIERGNKANTTNIHLLEERGIEIDDDGMDEEDRYGAVIRKPEPPAGAGAAGASAGAAKPAAALPRTVAPPRPAGAWGRGAPTLSQPIAIDPRRETNKVRAHITSSGSAGKGTSPYGTPKSKSTLASPLVTDVQKLEALNLDPGVPRMDVQTIREFEAFKAQGRPSSGAGPSFSVSELKQFSETLNTRMQSRPSTMSADAADSLETTPKAETESKPTPTPPKPSTLNPNAKSFSFNPNARSFTPTSTARPSPPPAPVTSASRSPIEGRTGRVANGNDGPPPPMAGGGYPSAVPAGYHTRRRDDDRGNRSREDDRYHDRRDRSASRHFDMSAGGMGAPPPAPPPMPGRSPPGHGGMVATGIPGMPAGLVTMHPQMVAMRPPMVMVPGHVGGVRPLIMQPYAMAGGMMGPAAYGMHGMPMAMHGPYPGGMPGAYPSPQGTPPGGGGGHRGE
jgi:hypothetical protein